MLIICTEVNALNRKKRIWKRKLIPISWTHSCYINVWLAPQWWSWTFKWDVFVPMYNKIHPVLLYHFVYQWWIPHPCAMFPMDTAFLTCSNYQLCLLCVFVFAFVSSEFDAVHRLMFLQLQVFDWDYHSVWIVFLFTQ